MNFSIPSPSNPIVAVSNITQKISILRLNPIIALALAILGLGAFCIYHINKLKNELLQKDIQVLNLNNNLTAAASEKAEILNKAQADLQQKNIELTEATNKKVEIQAELNSLHSEHKNLQTHFNDLSEALKEANKTNELITKQLTRLNQENTRLQKENEDLKQRLAPIEIKELPDYLPTDDSRPLEEKENLEQSINDQIGKGKVKQVWIKKNKDTSIVYYTTLTEKAKNELKEEVRTAQTILNTLKIKNANVSEFYLAIDLKESERPIRDAQANSLYTVQCERADKDLEKYLKESIPFKTRLQICLQVLKGLFYLQEAGFVQGDLKPENILVFNAQDESKLKVRIADFGKAVQVNSENVLSMRGNPRFSPPEFETSQKGEVFSAALVMIRILEEALLAKTPKPASLINIENPKDKAAEQRRGVEKYLVEHPNTYQFDQWVTAKGVWATLASLVPVQTPAKRACEDALYAYIDCLVEKLANDNHMQNTAQLKDLLRNMTCNDTKKRLSMADACAQFEALLPVESA